MEHDLFVIDYNKRIENPITCQRDSWP